MKKIRSPKVPSLQHLARIWAPDSEQIRRTLVRLATNGPTFSYQLIFDFIEDLLHSKIPYEQIECAVRTRVARQDVRSNFLELLPLMRDKVSSMQPSFVHKVSPRYYPMGRDLMIPFAPPFVYGENGAIHLPWFSFWKTNPMDGQRLSLFSTIVHQILAQDPDLESAELSIHDFSVDEPGGARSPKLILASEIPRLDQGRLTEMLTVFLNGYRAACTDLAEMQASVKSPDLDRSLDVDQLMLFD
ncbi:hypothetical protein [Xanthomonas euroxanthea]|uniref:hypothetical protein n=1 Tax=Xanthomonas euroxanthea TaxID=2259622 RepID=UPI00161D368B|nr:hypothetical protein [Xanthomonas euroxanthea]MBB5766715.1 hypothetical protein [Xanthomonas euroxanthea]